MVGIKAIPRLRNLKCYCSKQNHPGFRWGWKKLWVCLGLTGDHRDQLREDGFGEMWLWRCTFCLLISLLSSKDITIWLVHIYTYVYICIYVCACVCAYILNYNIVYFLYSYIPALLSRLYFKTFVVRSFTFGSLIFLLITYLTYTVVCVY